MTALDIINAADEVFCELQSSEFIPNIKTRGKTSTGNLAFNAMKFDVYVDKIEIYPDPAIAPYFVYTNEPWSAGRGKNPNEGWWDRYVEEFSRRFALKLKGKIKHD